MLPAMLHIIESGPSSERHTLSLDTGAGAAVWDPFSGARISQRP